MTDLCAEHPGCLHWQALITAARQTNAAHDAVEQTTGYVFPMVNPLHALRTGLESISGGICQADWPLVAEGFVMVQEVEALLRPLLVEMAQHEEDDDA